MVRSRVGSQRFLEVFVDCPLEVCEQRDVKGLYKKARSGEISSFTGISSPFEAPQRPDLVVKTNEHSLEECLTQLLNKIKPLLNQKL
jgi:adenylylsulfate kinase